MANPAGITILRNYTNTTPTITALDTYSGAVGSTVIVSGTNFSATAGNNKVFFGATQALVSAATTTSLTVTVPAGATYQPVTVTNSENTHTAYSPKPFMVTFSGGNNSVIFKSPVNFNNSNRNVTASAIGDLNGDGKSDLAVVSDGVLSIYNNTSSSGTLNTGSFTKVLISDSTITDAGLKAVKIADLDGDGKMDIIVSGHYFLTILRNNTSAYGAATPGSIAFDTKIKFYSINSQSNAFCSVDVADLDGDGKPEIINAITSSNYTYISVFKNTCTIGSINSASFGIKYQYTTGSQTAGVAISDLDGDGLKDIAVVNYGGLTNPNKVVVLRNTTVYPYLTFATGVTFTTANNPSDIAIGDIDSDNKPDLIVVNSGSNSISLFRNTATSGFITTSSFADKVDFTTVSNPNKVALADIDGDGKLDITVLI